MSVRLSLALQRDVVLPELGQIAVFHPTRDADLSALPRDRVLVIQPFFPDHAAWTARGFACAAAPGPDRFAAAVVMLPRAKALARALVAAAMAQTDGPVIVEGIKTDGIDSMVKDVRARVALQGPVSKAHGKLFWMAADATAFAEWQAQPQTLPDGMITMPGVFSADGVDPASELLVQALPPHPGRHVVDLGAGWGYLSRHLLQDAKLERLDLVEADHVALSCARRNVTDPRARFHWADALTWAPEHPPQAVVMNPPFHIGRAADPALGQAFVAAAARILSSSGTLWLVANRHLPYETALRDRFAEVTDVAGDRRFKILRADRPRRIRP